MPTTCEDLGDQDESLLERLLAWQEARANGRTLPVEDLCPDDPAGQAQLRAWISAVHGFDAFAGDGANQATTEPRSITCSVNLEVLRFHASGGLGEVYVARDQELNREVALKRIKAGADRPESRSRFLLEAEVTGGLEHPGIVPVYGLGHDSDGQPYYAMRFIRGDSFKDAIDHFHRADVQPGRDPGERTLALRQLLRRFVDVCNAVAYAHSRGVLHRDLKPGNVMLGPYGETLVVDWGLAKVVGCLDGAGPSAEAALQPSSGCGPTPTQAGSALGTPMFMSPEQAAGRLDELGPSSDVYSLGAMLYNLLAGRPPFVDAEREDLLQKVRAGEFPSPRQVNKTVPPALEAVCLKSMAREPAGRYPSPKALADEIEHWLADEPVSAWREPFSIRARRWMRRHRTAMTGGTAAVLAGLIGLGAVAAVQTQSNRELKQAYGRVSDALAAETKAKQEKEKALVQSEEARKRAEVVLGFLKDDVLSATRPEGEEGGLGKDVTVRKAVDAAEPKIAEAFKNQPLVEAEVRDTLGQTYHYLGEYPLAIRQYERAIGLFQTRLGPDHPDTLTSRDNLAVTYQLAGRALEAIRLHEGVLELRKSKLGLDHPDTLLTGSNLALDYFATGRYADALRLDKETLRLRENKLGQEHFHTITSRINLAQDYGAVGLILETIALDEATLHLMENKLGFDNPRTLVIRNNLAHDYLVAGRTIEAIRMCEETLKLSESKLGPDHPDTLVCRDNLAKVYEAAGRWTEAIALHKESLKLSESKLGPDHPQTLITRNNLAVACGRTGRTTEAIQILTRLRLRPTRCKQTGSGRA